VISPAPSPVNQETTDQRLDQALGNLLRAGVILAAAVTLLGGIAYVAADWNKRSDHATLKEKPEEQPEELRKPLGIIDCALTLNARCVIQLGLLLLIATPVARVAFTVFAFTKQRDWTYVVITLIVLSLLLYGLFWRK
jgi:uncharacterized membrane protein